MRAAADACISGIEDLVRQGLRLYRSRGAALSRAVLQQKQLFGVRDFAMCNQGVALAAAPRDRKRRRFRMSVFGSRVMGSASLTSLLRCMRLTSRNNP